MYDKQRTLMTDHNVCVMPKNLQVVSFDADWQEVYLGTASRDTFVGVCAHESLGKPNIRVKCEPKGDDQVEISCAKWCPLDKCTILVIGSQNGVTFYDWNGLHQIFQYDFEDNGIGAEERLVQGTQAKGIAALGKSTIAIGIHTGTIFLFEISTDEAKLVGRIVDSQRLHVEPIWDLASTSTSDGPGLPSLELLVSGDEVGTLNVWHLGSGGDGLVHRRTVGPIPETGAVTTVCLWNKRAKGVILCGFMNGSIKLFDADTGDIMVDITLHAAWITGMDLASGSGMFVTCAEDGFAHVWQLKTEGKIIEHRHAQPIHNMLLTGVKFLDPKGASFAISAYSSKKLLVFSNK